MPAKPATRRKTSKRVKVTFTLPAEIDATVVALCGEFNNWSSEDIKLARSTTGEWQTTLDLVSGQAYRYRYLLDYHRWENAWNADYYIANPYGGDDSVINLA
jgi:1,4-alpha-glucan branching enzyme